MQIDESGIDAVVYVHNEAKNSFYVKIGFNGMGMYINSFAVQPSKFENQEYWVEPPKRPQRGGGFKQIVEFDKSYPLWKIIERKALQAVKDYLAEQARLPQKDVVVEVDIDEPINLDDIEF